MWLIAILMCISGTYMSFGFEDIVISSLGMGMQLISGIIMYRLYNDRRM